jgi:hypothetical protein
MTRQAFDYAGSCILRRNATDDQAIKTSNNAIATTHIGLRAIGFLVAERKPLKILVQRSVPTVKLVSLIGGQQLAYRTINSGTHPSNPV